MTGMIGRPTVLLSTLTYELGKQLGIEAANRELLRQCQAPTKASLPVARMSARLRQIADVQLYHGASTSLPKARSRAAHEALKSKADYWLMIDDDVECDSATLARMFECAGRPEDPHAVVLPCLLRGAGAELGTVNVQWGDRVPIVLTGASGTVRRKCHRAGTGCMLLTRRALVAVDRHMANGDELPVWRDDDRELKTPLFAQRLTVDGEWLGEDFSFCDRLRYAEVELYALLTGISMHAGAVLELASLQ